MDGQIRRVLVTIDEGTWPQVWPLVRGVGASRVHVVLCTLGPPLSRARRAAALALPHVTLHESTWPLEWAAEPWADLQRAGAWLRDLAARHAVDVVHVNHLALGALPWGRPVVVAAHGCALSRWQALHLEPAPPCWDRYAHEVSRALRAADLVVAPSRALLDALEGLYGPLGTMRVVPYGADPPAAAGAEGPPFVLSAPGPWDAAAGVALLERIAARLPVPVYVAGPASVGPTRLRPLPAEDELSRWVARSPVFVHVARYEPFGVSALEAALAGCALVLADIPSHREVWGDAATYVAPDDAAAWIEVIDALVSVDGLRRDVAARARARAELWSMDRMVSGWSEAWRTASAPRREGEVTRAGGLVPTVPAVGLEQP